MTKVLWGLFAGGLLIVSVWLFYQEGAARPGALSIGHADNAYCMDCHTPWRGVGDEACLGCHAFYDTFALRPAIRFHEAEENCLKCHTEHRGSTGPIAIMDHTLLHPELTCVTCHFDPHNQLFGGDCRECHGLSSWKIAGYRHPPAERNNCHLCHRPPLSHQDQAFWRRLEQRHQIKVGDEDAEIRPNDCAQCHVNHSWRHLRM
ncbi:MAG: hypothetical protein KFF50_02750 [Desulfatitalea sp.]|nr:hypothetical protein [Desulfatitalea sp.]